MKNKNYRLLPYSVILEASRGDISAIEVVLKHYEMYITKLCTKTVRDKQGSPFIYLDENKKSRIESKLITKILTFKP